MAQKKPPAKATAAPKARTGSPKARGTDSDKEQAARFKKAARELGVDESGTAFERAVSVVLPSVKKP